MAQTRLTRELDRRPDLYDVYLEELLTLFADKGVAIQNTASSGHLTRLVTVIYLLMPIKQNISDGHRSCYPLGNLIMPILLHMSMHHLN